MKLDLFQSCGHCWAFQICCHIECSTYTASSFKIWNSSTGIPLPPLALFIVMLPMAHLISHSRMSVFMWVITPSQLSRSLRSLLYSSSVYSCHFLMLGPYHFCPLLSPSYMKYFLGISRSLEEISNLSHLLLSSISLHWLLRKAFLFLLAILWNSAFKWVILLFSFAFCFYSFHSYL